MKKLDPIETALLTLLKASADPGYLGNPENPGKAFRLLVRAGVIDKEENLFTPAFRKAFPEVVKRDEETEYNDYPGALGLNRKGKLTVLK